MRNDDDDTSPLANGLFARAHVNDDVNDYDDGPRVLRDDDTLPSEASPLANSQSWSVETWGFHGEALPSVQID